MSAIVDTAGTDNRLAYLSGGLLKALASTDTVTLGGAWTFTAAVDFDAGMTVAAGQSILGDGALTIQTQAGGTLTMHSDGNAVVELGDAAGSNKLAVNDSGSAEVFSVDSDGNVTAAGDLVIQGSKTFIKGEVTAFADNHILLNDQYTADAAQSAGIIANYDPTTTQTTTSGAGVFTAGVDATSDPTVTTAGAATFSASDIIMITGSQSNDGLYEVVSHAANTLTIRSTDNGVTNQVEDFTDGQFVAETDTGATITKVNVSVLRAGTDGVWETGSGSTTGITFSDLQTGAVTTSLDDAYNNGSTITVDSGPIVLNVSTTTGGALDINLSTAGETAAQIDIGWGSTTYTATPTGIQLAGGTANFSSTSQFALMEIDVSSVTLSKATDLYGIHLIGVSNAGAGSAVALKVNSSWDLGAEFASGVTLLDNVVLAIGTGSDLTVSHDGTDTTFTSATGNLVFDNTAATGKTIFQLGTDTTATAFQVKDNTGNIHNQVDGLGQHGVIRLAAFEALTAGQVVTSYNDSNVIKAAKADADDSTRNTPIGIVLNSPGVGQEAIIAQFGRAVVNTTFAVGDLRSFVYMDATTQGGLTTTAPITAGSRQYKIGQVILEGAAGTAQIEIQLQYIADF